MRLHSLLKKAARKVLYAPRATVKIELAQIDGHFLHRGKNYVVTGGSRGIGLAIAKKLLSEGAEVLITGRTEDTLKSVCIQLGPKVRYAVSDLSKISNYKNEIASYVNLMSGHIDGIVLNAGVSYHEGNFLNVTPDGFDQQIAINLKSNYFLAQSFIKFKLERKETADLLFISSETGGKNNDLPYGLTKVAENSLVGGLARRVYQKGIRVNAIAPGVTYTDMKKGKHGDLEDDYSNSSTSGRFIIPEEIAEIACFILSQASKCINGEVLYCDAGSHLKINGIENDYSF